MASLAGMKLGGCELLEEIGQGGMGVIYKARQVSLDRVVAVKILAEHLAHNPSFVERFQREARAIARINHTNILAVYDVGSQDNRHFMIMELVDGGNLAEHLARHGLLDAIEALEIILQAARGLECAAAANIIHRDVKPDNLMLTGRRVVKVSDFGLAKELDSQTMTETQAVMGTPAYMSPEQCDGRELDSRTDIYSLGGTFYRCVTGRLPFEAETAMSMMYRHKHIPLVPPDKIVPALPPPISEIVCRMMAKNREERFQSMAEVVRALEAAQKGAAAVVDLGKTMKLPAPLTASAGQSPEAERPGAGGGFQLPGADSRIIARPQSPQQVEDTAVRCRQSAENLAAQGKFAQAGREFRRLLELVPGDAEAKAQLREVERLASEKRMAGTEIRTLISSGHYEEALARWKALAEPVRDEQIAKQVAHLESAVVPSLRLVAQGDAAAAAGKLEESEKLYRQAAELDQASEKARQGLKNVERTRARVEFLIKEGYGHRQNRDYAQAVAVWEKILAADPANPQAKRLIIEARLAAAAEAATAEDFEKTVNHYEGLLKIDSGHEEAKELMADAVIKRDRVVELRRTAQLAQAKGDMTASAEAWRNLANMLPRNRAARQGLASARRALAVKRTKRLGAVLAVVVVLAGAIVFWRNWSALNQARAELAAGRYERAGGAADRVWLPILSSEAADIRHRAVYEAELQRAESAAKAGNWAEAARLIRSALDSYGDGPRLPELRRKEARYLTEAQFLKGQAAEERAAEQAKHGRRVEERDAWREAQTAYVGAKQSALDAGMEVEAKRAENHERFAGAMAAGIEARNAREPGWETRAESCFRQALLWRPGDPAALAGLAALGIKGGDR